MTIKSDKSPNISIKALTYFFLVVICGIGVSNIDYNIQSAFSQGNNSSVGISTFTGCPQIAYSGPTYTGPNGCPAPCPNNTLNPPPGCPSGFQPQSPPHNSINCPQIAYSGPTYTGPNGCPAPCPTNTNNLPPGCPQQSSLTTNNSLPIKIKSNKQ